MGDGDWRFDGGCNCVFMSVGNGRRAGYQGGDFRHHSLWHRGPRLLGCLFYPHHHQHDVQKAQYTSDCGFKYLLGLDAYRLGGGFGVGSSARTQGLISHLSLRLPPTLSEDTTNVRRD